jgi:hypothetical protein
MNHGKIRDFIKIIQNVKFLENLYGVCYAPPCKKMENLLFTTALQMCPKMVM